MPRLLLVQPARQPSQRIIRTFPELGPIDFWARGGFHEDGANGDSWSQVSPSWRQQAPVRPSRPQLKLFASLLLQFGPILGTLYVAGRKLKGWAQVKYLGWAFGLSGLSSYLGAKYLGIFLIARHEVIKGGDAAADSGVMALSGFGLVALYHLVADGVIPLVHRLRRRGSR